MKFHKIYAKIKYEIRNMADRYVNQLSTAIVEAKYGILLFWVCSKTANNTIVTSGGSCLGVLMCAHHIDLIIKM